MDVNAPMDDRTLHKNLDNHFEAIELCIGRGLRMPALILVYSAIDFLAWLGRPESKPAVDRAEFIRWTDAYLLANGFSQCAAVDIYSARCAHLHTNAFQSRMTKNGEAAVVLYAWGTADPAALMSAMRRIGKPDVRVVHVETLIAAVKKASDAFLGEVRADEHRWATVLSRSAQFFDENPALDQHINALTARIDYPR